MTKTFKLLDGRLIPAIAWGSGTSGLAGGSQRTIDIGKAVLEAGIRHIDTAQSYHTEESTGLTVKQSGIPRDQLYITTKISSEAFATRKPTPENIRACVEESIKKLGSIPDLLLIHNPYVPQGNIGSFWTTLESLVEDGTLKGTSLGVSNFRPQDFEEIFKVAKIKPAVHQLEYHPYVLEHIDPILAIHKQHGIVAESYAPLAPVVKHPTGGPLKPILEKISSRLSKESGQDVDPASVLLLWTLQRGVIPVTTSSRPENIKKLARVESLPPLTKEEDREIEQVGRKIYFRAYPEHYNEDFPAPNLPSDL